MPFEHSTFRRFVLSCCKASTAGQLPSFIQLRNKFSNLLLVTHTDAGSLYAGRASHVETACVCLSIERENLCDLKFGTGKCFLHLT